MVFSGLFLLIICCQVRNRLYPKITIPVVGKITNPEPVRYSKREVNPWIDLELYAKSRASICTEMKVNRAIHGVARIVATMSPNLILKH